MLLGHGVCKMCLEKVSVLCSLPSLGTGISGEEIWVSCPDWWSSTALNWRRRRRKSSRISGSSSNISYCDNQAVWESDEALD